MDYIQSEIFKSGNALKHGFVYLQNTDDLNELLSKTGLKFIKTVTQVHGNDFIFLNNTSECNENYEADAVITGLRGFGVGVYTADCVPIIFFDQEKELWGAIHAGWRGTVAKIAEKVSQFLIDTKRCKKNSLKFAVGPCIDGGCYEIGKEVADQFKAAFNNSDIFLTRKNESKYCLDIKKANIEQLKSTGIKLIDTIDICTMCDTRYPSYRRDGKNAGRMLSFIGLV